VFQVLDSFEFWGNLRHVRVTQLANGFDTVTNIRMIKAGLYLYSRKKVT